MNFIENVALSKVETLKIAGLSRATYYRWRKRLAETGTIKDLRERSNKVRTKDRDDVKECLFRILHSPPSDYGFNRTTWKQEDLRTALAQSGITLSLDNISSIIRSAGYRWRKAKKVLTSNDPDYRSKVQNIYRILSTLGSDVITQGVERGDRQWSGRDRAEHGSEGARAGLEAGCRHHGANRGLALGRPHGSVAVRVLALDHTPHIIPHTV